MKPTAIVLALLALVAGALIAGCGGDDDETTTTTSGASGATGAEGEADGEFVAAANEICKQATADLVREATEQYPEGPPTGADAERFVDEVVAPSLQQQRDAIAALTPPEGEEAAVEDLLSKLDAAIAAVEADPGVFIEGGGEITEATAAAQDLGITTCGRGE